MSHSRTVFSSETCLIHSDTHARFRGNSVLLFSISAFAASTAELLADWRTFLRSAKAARRSAVMNSSHSSLRTGKALAELQVMGRCTGVPLIGHRDCKGSMSMLMILVVFGGSVFVQGTSLSMRRITSRV